jgi:hypothetical protein
MPSPWLQPPLGAMPPDPELGEQALAEKGEVGHHHVLMRTTLTLDPDVAERLLRAVSNGGKSLKATVNEALRIGLGMADKPMEPPPFRIRAFVAGLQPGIDPDKMNQLLGELEAGEFARRHRG